ncbi:hypothetical protein GWI33_021366 [Rhynchophorus ferrugineus]|uniref:Uncharacterized protein n=1 Tax=Rhynchophorus ferrugineus TaxID=354439 RepID=A0A834HPQ1_RHYFE|nr:hypothetical protein GWI33_021366 [Rhynchophorus ferrugineus]
MGKSGDTASLESNSKSLLNGSNVKLRKTKRSKKVTKLQDMEESFRKQSVNNLLQGCAEKEDEVVEVRKSSRIKNITGKIQNTFETMNQKKSPLKISQKNNNIKRLTRSVCQNADRLLSHNAGKSDVNKTSDNNKINLCKSTSKTKTSPIASKHLVIELENIQRTKSSYKLMSSLKSPSSQKPKNCKKELIVKIDRLVDENIRTADKTTLNSVVDNKDEESRNNINMKDQVEALADEPEAVPLNRRFQSQMRNKLIELEQKKDHAPANNEDKVKIKQFNGKILRNKQRKHYAEESLEEEIKNDEPKPLKKRVVPIYRVQLPDVELKGIQDLYEFNDCSPKLNKQLKRIRNRKSSLIFDKHTYEVLRKIEAKEIKAKKKAQPKKKAALRKEYADIVNCIVGNVMEKVRKKNYDCEKLTNPERSKKVKIKTIEFRDFKNEINVTAKGLLTENNITTEKNIKSARDISDLDENSKDCCISPIPKCDSVDNYFGFTEESPISPPINIISNILIKSASTPVNFQGIPRRRPNANSTMRSPWRINGIATRPIFVSVKKNALPRIDQDMVLDHTVVKDIEESHSKTVNRILEDATKEPVQQSILDFVESNVERKLERSLFDYEDFQSPVKNNARDKENAGVNKVKRSLMGLSIVSSTPVQRNVLGDISNSSGELSNGSRNNQTLFGFDNSDQEVPQDENSPPSKPNRFDPSTLKNYIIKRKKAKVKVELAATPVVTNLDQSFSIVEDSDDHGDSNYKLFDEPESFLEDIKPIDLIEEKKRRRRRLDSSSSDISDTDHKQKKMKKRTKINVEQEKWIDEFNKQCEEVDDYDLILE